MTGLVGVVMRSSEDILASFSADVPEYSGMSWEQVQDTGRYYELNHHGKFEETPEYYIGLGVDQLCRQAHFHVGRPQARAAMDIILALFTDMTDIRMLDFGCGSGITGFEMARIGNQIVFSDLDGAGGFEFLKWRLKKYGVDGCETIDARELVQDPSLSGSYQYVLLLDIIEHLSDYKTTCDTACAGLEDGGLLVTNFFTNVDWNNVEHVVHDRVPCSDYLLELGLLPINFNVWVKNPPLWLSNICKATLAPFQGSLGRIDSELRTRRELYGD